ncbi:MAG: CHAT domain-containing protein [Cyanothece sp. SIO1E1]|nr:CHAT domain-containing protein [Cyanothece sp. SIO1E1]
MDDEWLKSIQTYSKVLPLQLLQDLAERIFRFAQDTSRSWDRDMIEVQPEPKPRYFNTLFTNFKNHPIEPKEPLVQGQRYKLAINISPQPEGLDKEAIFPGDALTDIWDKKGEILPLTVVASSSDFEFVTEGQSAKTHQIATMNVPRIGASDKIDFTVRPKGSGAKVSILRVEILYRGHIIQSKKIRAVIVPHKEAEIPDDLWLDKENGIAQNAEVTFRIKYRLDPKDFALLPERFLTLMVERVDPRAKADESIDFRLLDRTHGSQERSPEITYYDNTITALTLRQLISDVREQIKRTISGQHEIKGYENKLNGKDELLNNWLPGLADAGLSLRRTLLSDSDQKNIEGIETSTELNHLYLKPGSIIQINPVLGDITIPWGMVYEREIINLSGTTHVCSQFSDHDLDCTNCPSANDLFTVCPHAFWGYRYSIEQIPCQVNSDSTSNTLVRRIKNNQPLQINFNVYQKFIRWENHLKNLEEVGHIEIKEAKNILELFEVWKENSSEVDLIYFYCHGGTQGGKAYLKLSDENNLYSNAIYSFLKSSKLDWSHDPLVFLNACETGNYGPDSYLSLLKDFLKAGVCGVIGTECSVPERLAEAYAAALLPRLFAGEPLGQAMLEVRRDLLYKHKNPLGLVYSLYAAHEVALTKPVIRNLNSEMIETPL